jgi:hypothetical protein
VVCVLHWCQGSLKVSGRVALGAPGSDGVLEDAPKVLVYLVGDIAGTFGLDAAQDRQELGGCDLAYRPTAEPGECVALKAPEDLLGASITAKPWKRSTWNGGSPPWRARYDILPGTPA